MTDLLFKRLAVTTPGDALDLRFGLIDGTGPVDPDPPLPDPGAGLLRATWGSSWSAAAPAPAARVSGKWGRGAHARAAISTWWRRAVPCRAAASARWARTTPLRSAAAARWSRTTPVAHRVLDRWRRAAAVRQAAQARWRQAAPIARPVAARWRRGVPWLGRVAAPWRRGVPHRLLARATWQRGRPAVAPVRATWQRASGLLGWGSAWTPDVITPPGPVPCYQPEPGDAVVLALREAMPTAAVLVFACRKPAVKVIPIRKVYMVANDVSLIRVADGAVVPANSFTLSLDADSWAWAFSASIPPSALALVMASSLGDAVELEATVNGEPVRVLVESIQSERSFGRHGLRIAGRGRSARLDAPYALVETYSQASTLTAQQILDGLLPVGWTADWGITPWLVPAGTWSHQGSPMSAALAIAQAAGAYVQPHDTDDVVRVLPRWPTAPWQWSGVTPDIELPAAVVVREGITWVESPAWTGVHVAGSTAAGVHRLVKRMGSAGDVLAPAVTDQLITHDDAARPRGIHALARAGRWADVGLRMPVMPQTGIIRPGRFVRYTDGSTVRLGLSRGVEVVVGQGTVWQSIRLDVPINIEVAP